jgi:hypothetical protein
VGQWSEPTPLSFTGTAYIALGQDIWSPITTSYTVNANYITTGSATTLVYNQPWTWLGNANGTGGSYTVPSFRYAAPPALSPEERAARQRHREEVAAQAELFRQEHQAALLRSYDLLDELLTEEQRRELAHRGTITVHAPSGNRYRLHRGRHAGNVDMWHPEASNWSGRLCVHISEEYPDGDNLAAQLLAITTDEAHFLGTANIQDGEVPPTMLVLRAAFRSGATLTPEGRARLPEMIEVAQAAMPGIREVYEETQRLREQLRTGVVAA